ncbi:MAG TPA: HAMP domain-containing sensor histidine kinase [Thermoanaerobaculia bacterium]|nr:HAMP domain-containing sensor histidine kinase [Thermoanaerobaculia bacterium]
MPKVLRSMAIIPPSPLIEGRPVLWSHGLALLIVALATLLRVWLTPLVGPTVPFILFYPAVMLAGWAGGMRPGLTATLASALIAWYLFIPPFQSFAVPTPAVLFQLAVFILFGALLSFLNGALHRAREAAEEQARLLSGQQEERTRLLAAAEQARRRAEEASRSKDEFLAVVSHELRTPLNAILGWSQLLVTDPGEPGRLRRGLDAIVRSGRHQSQLIDDLLDVSRIISGKMRLVVRTVEPARVIESAIEAIRPVAEAKQIRLQVVLDPRAGKVAGDADRLQQVVWSLLTNAIKFTPEEGRVAVRLQRVGSPIESHIEIVVADNGIGISPELLPHIFDRFHQLDSSTTRAYGGLGLGLSIVRNLVELHGGTVEARSAGTGRGATFVVRLPATRRAHEKSPREKDTREDDTEIPGHLREDGGSGGGSGANGPRPPSPPG